MQSIHKSVVVRCLCLFGLLSQLNGCVVFTLSDQGELTRIPTGDVIQHPEILFGLNPPAPTYDPALCPFTR